MTTRSLRADLAARAAANLAQPNLVPDGNARAGLDFTAQLRSTTVQRDGKKFYQLDGHASVVETPYEMYDEFGPYNETIDRAAFDKTLGSGPDVAFLLNHTGMTMARTKSSGTLELSMDEIGLATRAYLNPERQDVSDLVVAVDDGDVDQMSFAFRIVRGTWSPDWMEYRLLEVDLDRGDVSAVNYGANPYTSISARAKQAFAAIAGLDGAALAEARARLDDRARALAGPAPDPQQPAAGVDVRIARLRASIDD